MYLLIHSGVCVCVWVWVWVWACFQLNFTICDRGASAENNKAHSLLISNSPVRLSFTQSVLFNSFIRIKLLDPLSDWEFLFTRYPPDIYQAMRSASYWEHSGKQEQARRQDLSLFSTEIYHVGCLCSNGE